MVISQFRLDQDWNSLEFVSAGPLPLRSPAPPSPLPPLPRSLHATSADTDTDSPSHSPIATVCLLNPLSTFLACSSHVRRPLPIGWFLCLLISPPPLITNARQPSPHPGEISADRPPTRPSHTNNTARCLHQHSLLTSSPFPCLFRRMATASALPS